MTTCADPHRRSKLRDYQRIRSRHACTAIVRRQDWSFALTLIESVKVLAVLRSVIAVGSGVLAGVINAVLVEWVGQWLYPLPESAGAPVAPGVFAAQLLAWAVGALSSGGYAAYLAKRNPLAHGLIATVFLMLRPLGELASGAYPGWFIFVALMVFPAGALAGVWIGTRPLPGALDGWTEDVSERP